MQRSCERWYRVHTVKEGVYQIDECDKGSVYLMEGERSALLIDTGWGIGKLAELVVSLTPLPVTVIHTHGHPDHTSGAFQFGRFYLHPADEAPMRSYYNVKARRWLLENVIHRSLPTDFDENAWIGAALGQVLPLSEGQVFDLGGRQLEVIALPGHTPGCVCFLERREGLLFSGDSAARSSMWLHAAESMPLSVYYEGMERLSAMEKDLTLVLPAHGRTPLPPHILTEIAEGTGKILRGEMTGEPFDTVLGTGLACAFDGFQILYRADNL